MSDRRLDRIPPHFFFLVSATFHYLGPAFAVLLFSRVAVLGVLWLRIFSAAVIFAIFARPYRTYIESSRRDRLLIAALGIVLAAMNAMFYEAIARMPLSAVATIEFAGPIALAAAGARSVRNASALAFAVAGVWLLARVHFAGEPIGYAFAVGNCVLFALYIIVGHRIASSGAVGGIQRLGCAMLIAAAVSLPVGLRDALPAFVSPPLLLAGFGVGLTSSVIPYLSDQLAMARLPRSSYALMLALLPAASAMIGAVVLRQIPSARDVCAMGLVMAGVALHESREEPADIHRLIADALSSSDAYAIVAHLADRIGARPSGSKNAALAVEWTTEQFRLWGLHVTNEPVIVPRWIRGEESACLPSHNDQRLAITALGGSVAAPELAADVIELTSLESIDRRVAGKIVYFHTPIDTGRVLAGDALAAYSEAVAFRLHGASRAAAHGAAAVLIHSPGSASLRTPHTGSVVYDASLPRIPAAALAAEDGMMLHRLLQAGDRVRIELRLTPSFLSPVSSANVIAEMRGADEKIVLIGAHLDSWDLGTGAVDNGCGVAMVMHTMRLIQRAAIRPQHTIRCVLFMNEEMGMSGARAYHAAHGREPHVAAIECDLGCAAPQGFATTLRSDARRQLQRRLAPLRVLRADVLREATETGVDTSPLVSSGVAGFGLTPDLRHYFDVHHSAADTLDKVDARELARCTAAVAGLTATVATVG